MQCQTCGDPTSPAFEECQRCGTRRGQPAVDPGVPVHGLRGLGVAASIAVGAATLLYLPVGLFPLVGVRMARSAAEQGDRDVLLGAVLAEALLSVPYLLALLTAATLVIIWSWRARKNLDAFPGVHPTTSAGWAIAGWLVPLANFVVPARLLAELSRAGRWRRATPLVGVWAVAWLVFGLGDRIVSRLESQRYERLTEWPRNDEEFATYVDFYEGALGARLVVLLACLVAGVTLILLVRQITAAQQDRIARAAPARPAWLAPAGYPAAAWGNPGPAFAHPGPASGHPVPAAGHQAPVPGHPAPVPGTPVAPGQAAPAQPVTGPSPQVAADPLAASPQVPPGAGGTIGA
ncbi:DUF4328 domain-containing protein [Micromonospora auratinigra]|uniref:DUF4328 domain-containing protein n=1 Tax=Micromonospora auratinigra TaxID=261654 RepID=A0A1A9A6H9_9ACTN|nr:DUF4328 domain-containing protein [Micromonospora auratinigra]SBT52083.1 protein of unknown function (DUF4328) [Micromonospora auratinigra]